MQSSAVFSVSRLSIWLFEPCPWCQPFPSLSLRQLFSWCCEGGLVSWGLCPTSEPRESKLSTCHFDTRLPPLCHRWHGEIWWASSLLFSAWVYDGERLSLTRTHNEWAIGFFFFLNIYISSLIQHLLHKSLTDLNPILFYDLFLGVIKKVLAFLSILNKLASSEPRQFLITRVKRATAVLHWSVWFQLEEIAPQK